MANEITVSESLSVKAGYLDDSPALVTRKFSFVATPPVPCAAGIMTVGTSAHEAIPMGDVTTAGWAHFENLNTTDYLEIGKDVSGTFHAVLKVKAGERFPCRLALSAPYVKAYTTAATFKYRIYQD